MADRSKIEWTDATWNPITGCTPVSPGCDRCYARRMAMRLRGRCGYPADDPFRVTLHYDRVEEPLRWLKPRRVFVCSMGDLFHDEVPDDFLHRVFWTMERTQRNTFMLLTKRPRRMADYTRWRWGKREEGPGCRIPSRNIWLGVTVEDQQRADERIPLLLACPAAVRFVSCEPLLGPVVLRQRWLGCRMCREQDFEHEPDLCSDCAQGLDWVIAGGETGPGARPAHPDWFRSLRDQCAAAGVPFSFKQWGEWSPQVESTGPFVCSGDGSRARVIGVDGLQSRVGNGPYALMGRVGKLVAGAELDGRLHREWPKE